jgi:hypothetical protein
MRIEPETQWAIIPQFTDMARICAASHTIEELTEKIFTPMATWLGVDLISLTLIEGRSVVTVADGEAPDILMQRIRTHAARCIGINATHPGDCDEIRITPIDTGIARTYDGIEGDAQILWTAALQHEGRLIAVLTLYRNGTVPLSPLEITTLKQMRGLVSSAIVRIAEVGGSEQTAPVPAISPENDESVFVLHIQDTALIVENFGSTRLRQLQNEVVARVEEIIREDAVIARVGSNRVIVISEIYEGLDAVEQIRKCVTGCKSITVAPGIYLDLTVEVGEVLHSGDRGVGGLRLQKPQAPTTVDILAG